MSWSHTLHLPKSQLANRSSASLIKKNIPKITTDLFKWQQGQTNRRERVLHDGPPYANGDLHVGHALNKVLKDIVNRHNVNCGFRVPYIPGWDCHGLPIEHAALKRKRAKAEDKKTALGRRKLAKELALEMVQHQMQGFIEFGVMADWTPPTKSEIKGPGTYLTLTPDYVARELNVFAELLRKKLIFRQRKPVWWSVESATALAESELEYGERVDTAVYFKYRIASMPEAMKKVFGNECSLAVWTTTPWTLPANQAVAINPNIEYVAVKLESSGETLIVAKNLVEHLASLLGPLHILGTVSAEDLLKVRYSCPLRPGNQFPVIVGEHVTDSSGTGLVHTAPGHGKEDFLAGQAAGLKVVSPVDARGRYTEEVMIPSLVGLDARKEGTPLIIKMLGDNLLLKHEVSHSVPLDWRTKTPVMVRATPQFFIDLGAEVREMALKALDNVDFRPKGGEHRLRAFVQSRSDWCISRQRAWGVPIPILYNKTTGEPILDCDVVKYTISQISALGPDAWFEEELDDVSRWLPENLKSNGTDYFKGTDTLDVWLDSGSSWTMLQRPADIYLEGSDQHRGWFQSSLLTHVAVTGKPEAPFKRLVTHGFVLDANRQKMSKSLGNVVDPKALISRLGVDGMRLLIAQSDYTSDVSLSETNINQVASMIKKFRLTFKYLLGNLGENPVTEINQTYLSPLDKYMLMKLLKLTEQCKESYDTQNFQNVVKLVQTHMNTELSAIYFDAAKDVLYADKTDSPRRMAIQYTLFNILDVYVRMLAPIMPLLTQEVWDVCPPAITRDLWSPLMAGYPELSNITMDSEVLNLVSEHLDIRDAVNEAISLARAEKLLGSSLACDVYIDPKIEGFNVNPQLIQDICVSSHVFVGAPPQNSAWVHSADRENYKVYAVPPSEHKCPRCWKFNSPEQDTLCKRCEDAVSIN